MNDLQPESFQALLDRCDRIAHENPPEIDPTAFATACWSSFTTREWPAAFRLLDIGAGLPRLGGHPTLAELPHDLWPRLTEVTSQISQLQVLVDHPIIPDGSRLAPPSEDLAAARARVDDHHCATVDFFLGANQRRRLDVAIDALRPKKDGSWGALTRAEAPEVHDLMATGLANDAFRHMTGYDPARDTFSVTLSLQNLETSGIGWHRDLYWPAEWVGQDVFAVFYALGNDSPDKGGAFVYYLPWHNQVHHFYRQRHQATVLWNSADPDGRILHAVSGYHGADTERHLMILQCLRRRPPTTKRTGE